MNPIYRFFLSAGGTTQQAFPIYKDDLTIEQTKEQGQQFFRGKLSGKLTFEAADYSFIVGKAFDTKFGLEIQISYTGGTSWSAYWKGKFYKTDCEFNEDNETISVTPNVDDVYEAVLAGLEKEYDLIKLAPAIAPVKADKRPMVQVYVPGQSVIGCFLSGMWWEQECEPISNEGELESLYHFQQNKEFDIVEIDQEESSAPGVPILPLVFAAESTGSAILIANDGFTFKQNLDIGIYQIIRNSDNVAMWESTGFSSVLEPVPGTGADGFVYITINIQRIYGRYVCDVETGTYQIRSDDPVADNRNYTRVVEYYDPDTIDISDQMTPTPTQWGIYQPGQYYNPPALPQNTEWFPIGRAAWGRASFWFRFSANDWTNEAQYRQSFVLKEAYPLWSVISVLLGQVAPGVTHEGTTTYSQFLYGTNPILHINQTLLITPKSNLISAGYDQPAQKAPITLAQVLNMLRDCFRCYWFIDSSNRFRIEHIEYFRGGGVYFGTPAVGVNLKQIKVSRNGKEWAFAQGQYRFDKPDMAARYQFSWMDDVTTPFEGFPIDIVSGYVNPDNIEQVQVNNFTSDIDYILLNPSAISQDGFVLLAAITYNGELVLPYRNFVYNFTAHILQNAFVAFIYLQQYYAYDMPAKNYRINGMDYIAQGVKRLKKQSVRFPAFNDVNLLQLVKTNLGDGTIEKISINLSSRSATAELAYDTEQ